MPLELIDGFHQILDCGRNTRVLGVYGERDLQELHPKGGDEALIVHCLPQAHGIPVVGHKARDKVEDLRGVLWYSQQTLHMAQCLGKRGV